MILRRSKEGQSFLPFWGCGTYPNCKGTRRIDEDGKPELTDEEENDGRWGSRL